MRINASALIERRLKHDKNCGDPALHVETRNLMPTRRKAEIYNWRDFGLI